MDYIRNERNVMHLQREPDKPDRISWVVDVIFIIGNMMANYSLKNKAHTYGICLRRAITENPNDD